MDTRKIGQLDASVIGLGCNNFGMRIDADAATKVVHTALDVGITFFDTADTYGGTLSEEYLGKALGSHRDEVLIATKFGSKIDEERHGARPDYVRRAVDDSLRRLGTDWIDLYQLHFPDPQTPIADTLGALDELVKAGKVREIGCSNFSVDQLREADEAATAGGLTHFVSVQNQYNLLHREPEEGVLAECDRLHLAFLPYFPLAAGLLTGKYRRNQPLPEHTRLTEMPEDVRNRALSERRIAIVERLIELADSEGHRVLELAIAWLLSRPQVASVIAGATSPEQVRANVKGADWQLSDELLARIDELAPRRD